MRCPIVLFLLACSAAALAQPLSQAGVEQNIAALNQKNEQTGNPFRVSMTTDAQQRPFAKASLIGSPCVTSAQPKLMADVRLSIGQAETQFGGIANPTLVETRCVSNSAETRLIEEVWVVARGLSKIVYTVTLSPKANGGTGISVHGPWGNAP